jgi:glutamine synthetase
MNTIVAESLDHIATELERKLGPKATPGRLQTGVRAVLKAIIRQHKRIIFNGDGYSPSWRVEAQKRGLPDLADSVEAIPVLGTAKAIRLFGKYKVLTRAEVESRVQTLMEKYAHQLEIEAEAMVLMARQLIFPAATTHQTNLARAVSSCKEAGVNCSEMVATLEEFVDLLSRFKTTLVRLEEASERRYDDVFEQARCLKRVVHPVMDELRELGDKLETRVAADLWPLASYRELLFIK